MNEVSLDRATRAIERVLGRYCALVDNRETAGWESCFTSDARLTIEPGPGVARRGVELDGLTAIVAAFSRTTDDLPRQLHQVALRSVAPAAPGARVLRTEATFVRYDAGPSGPEVGSFGRYLDEWAERGSEWRIRSRRILIDSSVPSRRPPADPTHEIREVILRYCRAVDRRDYEAVRACYHPDAVDHHGSYHGGVDGFIERLEAELPKCERTFHVIANLLVDQVTPDSARCESYALAYHRLPASETRGVRDRVVALRYLDRFERRSGAWRIAQRTCVCEWTRTDPVPKGWDFGPEFVRGVPGASDPIFAEG